MPVLDTCAQAQQYRKQYGLCDSGHYPIECWKKKIEIEMAGTWINVCVGYLCSSPTI